MAFESIPVEDKRQALKDWAENILFSDFGEEFVYHQIAKTQMLNMNSRVQLLDVAQNTNGDIRHCEVFWDGPEDPSSEVGTLDGLFRQGNKQIGSVDGYKIVVNYGVEYDEGGQIDNRKEFESIFTSYDPKGLLVSARQKNTIEVDVDGTKRTALLSLPINPLFPPTPRPLHSGSNEYAHYAEFRLLITDM
jgi:hypothetical protein